MSPIKQHTPSPPPTVTPHDTPKPQTTPSPHSYPAQAVYLKAIDTSMKLTTEITGKQHPSTSNPATNTTQATKKFHRRSLLAKINRILQWTPPPLQPSPFQFLPTHDAATHNFNVLKKHKFNLHQIISAHPNTPIAYGSEFKPPSVLHNLLHRHPKWPKVASILKHGTTYPLIPLDESARKADLESALQYGNHKSASHPHDTTLSKLMVPDITNNWLLPLLPTHATHIPDGIVAPFGIAQQNTLDADGSIIPKLRPTHDLSFPGKHSGTSVNSRIISHRLEPCNFGFMHRRLIHYIIGCRERHPQSRIFIQKLDWKSAYRRQHLHGRICGMHLFQILYKGITLLAMALRLPFGGQPCASEWSCTSEIVADITDNLLRCTEWNPQKLHAPAQGHIPPPLALDTTIPFAQAKPTAVDIPANDSGYADVYIDDMVSVAPDIQTNASRLEAAGALAVHTFSRAPHKDDHTHRDPMLSENKLRAEGRIEETKTILGWIYNTRSLTVALPPDKFHAWTNQIKHILESKQSNRKDLETLTGRLNHAATVNPLFRHFLGRIRHLTTKAPTFGPTRIPQQTLHDLRLWISFLAQAHQGFSMNSLSYRQPSIAYRSDACEHGIGGFSNRGRAWRFEFPAKLRGRAHINLLEFIACIVGIWIDAHEQEIPPESCLLALSDNTSATGWLERSNFHESHESDHDQTSKLLWARKLATIVTTNRSQLFSQWFPGHHNDIADSLSRDTHIPTSQLTASLTSLFPSQIPPSFRIKPLPTEIASFIYSTLLPLPVQQQRLKPHTPSALAHGNATSSSLNTSASRTTPFSTTSPDGNVTSSCPPSHNSSGTSSSKTMRTPQDALQQMAGPWQLQQSQVPLATWHKAFVPLTDQTHA